MPLPEAFLQELKHRCNLAEIAAPYVNLRRSGRNLVGLCPFHSEKTPSFHIYPDNDSFYCFGCGAGGDVITFIRRLENLDYIEAVKFLADRAGLQMPEDRVDDGYARLKARILEINRETARFYYHVLMSAQGRSGLEYLTGRALTARTIRHFGLGFSPETRFALVDHLAQKGYRQDELVQANVAFRSARGRLVDRFFGRVMYPIIDLRGNVIAFGGRILGDGKPKYLNTSDTPVFRKSSGLFAMNFAKNSANGQLILAEGYMDVIALHQAGFTNAIATLGTALTAEQARLMARYAKEVVICYDADGAGQKATARAIPILREAGLEVRVLTVTGGKDPDEFLRSHGEQGPARFKQLLEGSRDDVEYRLQKIRDSCDMRSAAGRVSYLTQAADLLATLDSKIEQEVYASKIAAEQGVDRSAVLLQIARSRRKTSQARQKQEFRAMQQASSGYRDSVNPEKGEHLRAANAEEALLAFLFDHPDMARKTAEKLPPEKFCTEFNRRVYRTILGKMIDGKACSLTDLSGEFSVEEISAIARILAVYHPITAGMEDAKEYIDVILQEGARLGAAEIASADGKAIQAYLQTLREQKK